MIHTRCCRSIPRRLDLDPFAEATIRLANPAFGTFLNAREVLAMAQDAKRMPAREVEYRNLVLNQRIETSNPFISAGGVEGLRRSGGLARRPSSSTVGSISPR